MQMFQWFCVVFIVVWVGSSFVEVVKAQSTYSNDSNAYDFGWISANVYSPDSVPTCGICVNALDNTNGYPEDDDRYYNRSVGVYRCDGVQPQEFWAYDTKTNVIISSNLTPLVLCVDAEPYSLFNTLKLRPCDSSKESQKWRRDGTSLVNGLLSNSKPLSLVAEYPDKETNPTNQAYSGTLLLGSPTTLSAPTGLIHSSDFSILPSEGFVDKSINRFTVGGLLKVSNSSQEKVVNGGFENSTIQAGTDISASNWQQNYPSYFALCGWVMDFGPLDYVKAGYIAPQQGSFSVHLNTGTNTEHRASISQTIGVKSGREYDLSFYMTAFPYGLGKRNCSANYKTADLLVRVTNAASTSSDAMPSAVTDTQGFNRTFTAMAIGNVHVNWILRSVRFKASSNVTTISFISLNFNNQCGPMVDAVSVSRVVPPSNTGKIVVASVVSVAGVGLVIAGILAFVYSRRSYLAREEFSALYKTEHARIYSSKEIRSSTNRFKTVLGEGGFGTVYKADFRDGTVGAVKVEKLRGLSSSKKVLAQDEIAVLLRVHHRNLVNLMGFCIHRGQHMLVFEFLPNGSLYERLHQSVLSEPKGDAFIVSAEKSQDLSKVMPKPLPWSQRMKIACDVAYGLEYLHHDADPPVVHRDVKSHNILLTATDSAKLADFGLSKAAPVDATSFQSIETMVRGSIGYLDPQYFLTGLFSPKSDVYSYGVVLLELISGHPAIYNAASISSWAAPFLSDPSLYPELVDKKLDGEFDRGQLESLVELSVMCMQEDGKQRPNMRQVVAFLSTKHLSTGNSDSIEIEKSIEVMSREEYHKNHPLFIDFDNIEYGSTEMPDLVVHSRD